MPTNEDSEIIVAINKLQATGNYQILRRLQDVTQYNVYPNEPKELHRVCVIDTETTGLDTAKCEIIELGYQVIEFDSNGNFYKVLSEQNFLNEPKEPIPEEVSKVTGITMQDVQGHKIPWKQLEQELSDVDLFVAHNASFDRPIVERYSNLFKEKVWGCSLSQIDWFNLTGVNSRTQDILCWKIGNFFYDAHRALTDVKALSNLLSCKIGEQQIPALNFLLQNIRLPKVLIKATSAPFAAKDMLKQRGYRWNLSEKVWQTIIPKNKQQEELDWLTTQNIFQPNTTKIKAIDTFSTRVQ